ncbi:MAG: DUF6513 domain-containing protein [Gemmataceae bacterium]
MSQLPHLLFVTGKLAEPALRRMLDDLAPRAGFTCSVAVLPITVAALATTSWIARHLTIPEGVQRIILPGMCNGDLAALAALTSVPVERGPADLRDLPDHFRVGSSLRDQYGAYDIAILAEINHAPRLDRAELLRQAQALEAAGADLIDLGCDPGSTWPGVADAVRALCDIGLRVSIDTFDPIEVEAAVRAGAELVLSVNGQNARYAGAWGVEVVVIPDQPGTLDGIETTLELLTGQGVSFRLDPILEPIGMGFAASLSRYQEARRRFPQVEMMMGVGNLTELTDVDSAGINLLMLAFCQELGIRSVLTTQVVPWAQTAVRELDVARRLVHFALQQKIPPKRVDPRLVMLRDPRLHLHGPAVLAELASRITDRNFRLFAEAGQLHVMNAEMHLKGTDPFDLFDQLQEQTTIDPSHAFYLGYELAKAVTALTLGKNYVQDQALRWGMLTRDEQSHRAKKKD